MRVYENPNKTSENRLKTRSYYTHELVSDGNIHLRVDYKAYGIGSGSCGPALIEKYQFSEKEIEFCFFISAKQ